MNPLYPRRSASIRVNPRQSASEICSIRDHAEPPVVQVDVADVSVAVRIR